MRAEKANEPPQKAKEIPVDKAALLETLKESLHPELVRQIQTSLPDDFAVADNQNQNQGGLEDIANMKPEVLRSMGFGIGSSRGEEVMDNQNQNQSKLEDLMRMKPAALESLRSAILKPGDEVMDNQNQNQGTQAAKLAAQDLRKPG